MCKRSYDDCYDSLPTETRSQTRRAKQRKQNDTVEDNTAHQVLLVHFNRHNQLRGPFTCNVGATGLLPITESPMITSKVIL